MEHGASTTYHNRYHFVWIVKYRKGLLSGALVPKFKEILVGIAERYDFVIDMVGTDSNHVHCFIGAPPRYSEARIMQIIKSISARKLFESFPELRKELWGGELWGDGYFVRTVGASEITEDVIRAYIERQGKETAHAPFEQLRLL